MEKTNLPERSSEGTSPQSYQEAEVFTIDGDLLGSLAFPTTRVPALHIGAHKYILSEEPKQVPQVFSLAWIRIGYDEIARGYEITSGVEITLPLSSIETIEPKKGFLKVTLKP
jgi:hypothetical protein